MIMLILRDRLYKPENLKARLRLKVPNGKSKNIFKGKACQAETTPLVLAKAQSGWPHNTCHYWGHRGGHYLEPPVLEHAGAARNRNLMDGKTRASL